ncbi:MAG: aspartate kinase, partial [Bacteroidetes bacterium]
MIIFKFGGASVRSADAVRNMAGIMNHYQKQRMVVVVSAMGKTTNALERIVDHFTGRDEQGVREGMDRLREYHMEIVEGLFGDRGHPVYEDMDRIFAELAAELGKEPTLNYDFDYDRLIGFGEILSTRIIYHFLDLSGFPVQWLDIRRSLKTDSTWREARVDWELSSLLVRRNFVFDDARILVTQGFLGSNINDATTSLGREGSDYTAAILAYIMKPDSVTIWKDVPGVLNADPKYFDDTILLEKLSYLDAIELAYFGTSVIHPKTIKPLQNRHINLHVKSFLDPQAPGTLVGNLSYDK